MNQNRSKAYHSLAIRIGLAIEHITATTCPYGDLNQHLDGSANCELGLECIYSGVPFKETTTSTNINLGGARRVLKAIAGED